MRLTIFLLICSSIFAVSGQTHILYVSPLTGSTIDQSEYQRYRLDFILSIPAQNIDSLRVVSHGPDSLLFVHWYLASGDSSKMSLAPTQYNSIKYAIELKDIRLLKAWKRLQGYLSQGLTPEVRLVMRNTFRVSGTVYPGEGHAIRLVSPERTYSLTLADLAKIKILSIGVLEGWNYPQFGFPNFNRSQYLLAPSAIPLRKREIVAQNVLLSEAAYTWGITDHLTATVGIDLSFLLLSAISLQGPLIGGFLNLRYGTSIGPNLYAGVGLMSAGLLLDADREFARGPNGTLGYGMITLGDVERSLTLGMGVTNGMSFSGEFLGWRPTVSLSGIARVTPRLSLITENWYFASPWGSVDVRRGVAQSLWVFMGGVRLLWPRVSFNLALAPILIEDLRTITDPLTGAIETERVGWNLWGPFPFVSFAYRMGY
ncbi:MAG: hypothetical protein AAF804_00800 [Bacteroidota bacterium]